MATRMPYAWCGANAPATATQDAAGSKPRQNDAAALLERAEAHVNLGIALADSTDLSGALSEFSEAVRLAPSNGTAHYNRGRVLGEMNRDTEAKTELERAASLLIHGRRSEQSRGRHAIKCSGWIFTQGRGVGA